MPSAIKLDPSNAGQHSNNAKFPDGVTASLIKMKGLNLSPYFIMFSKINLKLVAAKTRNTNVNSPL